MRTLNSGALAAIDSGTVHTAMLIEIVFHGGATTRINTSNFDLTYGGNTYEGAYGVGTISPIKESAGQVNGLQFELSATSGAMVTLAMDGADQWQGSTVTIRTAIISAAASGFTVEDAPIRWTGYGDQFTVKETPSGAVLVATAESSEMDLLRGFPLTYSHADQQLIDPGDKFFEYVVSQSDAAVVWPAKEWFYK